MIHVDRKRAIEPNVFRSSAAKVERQRAARFFDPAAQSKRAQRRFDFHEDLWQKAGADLRHLFRNKCAYCETPIDKNGETLIDHFRPLTNAKDLNGSSSRVHYWWLAYEWSNLYLVCAACQKAKATQFPVEHDRAKADTTGQALSSEGALLLDPCGDEPDAYVHFDAGYAKPRPLGKQASRNTRAEITIEVLALNRKELVRDRAIEMEKVEAAVLALGRRAGRLVAGGGASRSNPVNRVREQLKPWLPFVAARRAAARDALGKLGGFGRQLLAQLPELTVGESTKARTGRGAGRRGRRTAYVTKLSIRNFKVISKLDLTFEHAPARPADQAADGSAPTTAIPLKAGWKVLLGENGTGKSTVLQALALALAGDREVKRRFLNADKLLRRTRGKLPRPREGLVNVTLSNGETIEFRVTRGELMFTQGPNGAQTYLRAYGATRNLPNTRPPASWAAVEATVRIIGIFDSNSPLCSAERWLAGLKKPRFDAVALALKDLLRLDKRDGLRRVSRKDPFGPGQFRKTVVDIGSATVELDELSDGYQSMIALAIDIMAGLPKTSTDFQSDTGIVLLDELGNHLHPRWRMEVVSSLQRAFPRIQFIATTHEPLCLRGLVDKEIAVMRMENRALHVDTDVPSPERFRVDQLLTSKFFGLHSTVDPTVERKFDRYYKLLAKTSRTASEETERSRLSAELTGVGVLGHTRRDQLVYEVIDQYIAREPKLANDTAAALKEETKKTAAERWHSLESMLEEPR